MDTKADGAAAGSGSAPGKRDHMCCECEDQEAALTCLQCDELFCRPCWQQQHNGGKRRRHETQLLLGQMMVQPVANTREQTQTAEAASTAADATPVKTEAGAGATAADSKAPEPDRASVTADLDAAAAAATAATASGSFREDYRFIPLRLTDGERQMFQVLEGALNVSEYTDRVDVYPMYRMSREPRMVKQLNDMFSVMVGLVACVKNRSPLLDKPFEENEEYFRKIFELGRRYKIMNPDKMRSTYGKLMYMLQDACTASVQRYTGIDPFMPILTVTRILKPRNGLGLLEDPLFEIATAEVPASAANRAQLLSAKVEAKKALCAKHQSDELPRSIIERCIASVADSNNYQLINARPVRRMIEYLTTYFSKSSTSPATSLEIRAGRERCKLSHGHSTQFTYVHQSLTLWLHICQQMFRLWHAADRDLLGDRSYHLSNTGQGMNRVQGCPAVSQVMHSILSSVQRQCGSWVGISVVHLGDRDVPNALMFIDKYTQVPRILAPVVQVLDCLPEMAKDPFVGAYIKEAFGSADRLRMLIMRDFFRLAFNGDGDDGGSCIDGRLTSTWNWCSKLEKKPYYRIFLLAGFQGFDGSFKA